MKFVKSFPHSSRFRVSMAGGPSQQARALRIDAERCFRLAEGTGSLELAEELEALGRAFQAEAEELTAAMNNRAQPRELSAA